MKKSFSSGTLQKSGQAAHGSTLVGEHFMLCRLPIQATITSPMAAEHSSVCLCMFSACFHVCAASLSVRT